MADNEPLDRTPGGGLLNPEVKNPDLKEPNPGAMQAQPSYQPVREPRWQIIISLIIVAIFIFLWLLSFITSASKS